MSKCLAASCTSGIVTVAGLPVPGVTLLSQGTGQSTGFLIIDEDDLFYVAKTSGDLNTTLEKLIDALTQTKAGLDKTVEAVNKAASALTTLDTAAFLIGATAGVPSPPMAASDISAIGPAAADITAAATNLATIKADLTTLKGSLT